MKQPKIEPNVVILETVRKLRTYVNMVDTTHLTLESIKSVGDPSLEKLAAQTQDSMNLINTQVANFLKALELSKPYKDMLKAYNAEDIEEDDDET